LGGYVIQADVREHVFDLADDETTNQAGHICLLLTNRLIRVEDGNLREFRIQLLMEKGDDDLALVELSTLWHLYLRINDQVGLFRVAMNTFKIREYLGAWDWLERARIFLQFGLPSRAQFWLSREPDNPIDVAYWLSLQAELSKMEGNIRQAHENIDKAVSLCNENRTNPALSDEERSISERDYLHYRHDRARLLHFDDNDYVGAVNEYEAIMEEITEAVARGGEGYSQLMAVTHRNLGECILDLGGLPEDAFREAESHLQTAITIEGSLNPFSNLISETYYQLARLELKRTKMEQARQYLQMCVTSAQVNHFGMMSAIAQNRLMWLDIDEKKLGGETLGQRWGLVSANLRGFAANSWAGRTLINANIKMASLMMIETQLQKGQEMLEENLDLIRSNQNLRRKGDLMRIVKTLAGLQTYEDGHSGQRDFWGLLKNEFRDAGIYAFEMGWLTPQEAWPGGI